MLDLPDQLQPGASAANGYCSSTMQIRQTDHISGPCAPGESLKRAQIRPMTPRCILRRPNKPDRADLVKASQNLSDNDPARQGIEAHAWRALASRPVCAFAWAAVPFR